MYGILLIETKIISHIQLCYISGEEFRQWNKSFVIASIIHNINYLYAAFYGEVLFDEIVAHIFVLVLAIIVYTHLVFLCGNSYVTNFAHKSFQDN